jgi:methionyl-tRNA formyltransferase
VKIIFAGTPDFAIPSLRALLNSKHTVCAVYTQPDRPAGRGRKLTASPVKLLAEEHQLPIYQPLSLRDADAQKDLANLHADLMIVIAYGLILPPAVLSAPKFGCMNVHASLLPRWRGAAPIQRALLAGDTTTGITLMQMDQGLDTGMLEKTTCPIHSDDTAQTLHDRLAVLGAETLLRTLTALEKNSLHPEAQDDKKACYAPKLTKHEALLNWQDTAENLARAVRAFNPWPIAYTTLGEETIRIWQAEAISSTNTATPGTIIHVNSQGLDIATGSGVLRVLRLQLPGAKPLTIAEILNAHHAWLAPGTQFTC